MMVCFFQPGMIDEIARGLVATPMETLDQFITGEVTNHLFEDRKIPFSGVDLIALNVQRGKFSCWGNLESSSFSWSFLQLAITESHLTTTTEHSATWSVLDHGMTWAEKFHPKLFLDSRRSTNLLMISIYSLELCPSVHCKEVSSAPPWPASLVFNSVSWESVIVSGGFQYFAIKNLYWFDSS